MVDERSVTERDLHAYLDGQLDDPELRQAVEAYLEANPSEAKRFDAYAEIERMLRAESEKILAEPVPDAMRDVVVASRRYLWPGRVAAGIAVFALGTLLGWSIRGPVPQEEGADLLAQNLVRPAAVAHAVYSPEIRHPVEVTAEEEAHLAAWLSKRLGKRVVIPQLQEVGYRLVGGRLLPAVDGSPAAQFMYENGAGQRLTLYVRSAPEGESQASFRYEARDGIGVFYWIDASFAYALSGEISREHLLTAARLAYHSLNP
ncbi:MAG: anti-sigma factor [Gammaproteobacteria bacterium]